MHLKTSVEKYKIRFKINQNIKNNLKNLCLSFAHNRNWITALLINYYYYYVLYSLKEDELYILILITTMLHNVRKCFTIKARCTIFLFFLQEPKTELIFLNLSEFLRKILQPVYKNHSTELNKHYTFWVISCEGEKDF